MIEGTHEPVEPSVVAGRVLITTGSMTSILDTLERRALVRRLPHPDDRRKLLIEVTDAGVAILDELLPSLHQRERAVMESALTPGEQQQLLALLAKVQHAASQDDARSRPAPRIRQR